MHRPKLAGSLVVILGALAAPAWAQSGGLFSGRSPANPSPRGQAGMGGTGGMGGLGATGGLGGLGGMGTGGMAGLGAGMGAINPLAQMGLTSGTGTMAGAGQGTGFVGRGNTGFVGNRLAGSQATAGTGGIGAGRSPYSMTTRGGLTQSAYGSRGAFGQQSRNQVGNRQQGRFVGSANGGFGGFGGGFNGAAGAGGNQNIPLHVRTQIAFTYPEVPAGQPATRLEAQLTRMVPQNPEFRQVSLQLDGAGTVVLQGVVPTAAAAELAEAIVRLEPGVRQVRNELQVAQP